MKKLQFSPIWKMSGNGYEVEGKVPGSVYSFLLNADLVEDPYYRNNEEIFFELAEHEYEFTNEFDFTFKDNSGKILLHCDGLDTLCELYINDKSIGSTNNMHRTYEFDVTDALVEGKNTVKAKFLPVNPYIKKMHKENKIWDDRYTMKGATHIRKAYCMMGWDWGPMLPDAGIWRDIYLLVENSARIEDFRIIQEHKDGEVFVTTNIQTSADCEVSVEIKNPLGSVITARNNQKVKIDEPMLWWPVGLGEQYLYEVTVSLIENGIVVDKSSKKIGLRTLELIRERDRYGESFNHRVNGLDFFAMGGDYIPEDNIFSRITPERSRKLLMQCRDANFNAIRVWGGGYYPDDWFFDICDELGLVVFMDMMFACSQCPSGEEYYKNITVELEQNVARIRHHACIALLCGNNEIEMCYRYSQDKALIDNYVYIFEDLISGICKRLCPEIPYVPSSPSTVGQFVDPTNENFGDSHYWDVWHGNKPFTEYRNHYFRYLSEFGFQSFPCEKTVEQFSLPEDRNIFSRVMEKHQRNGAANRKILMYLSDTYKYPSEFGTLLYASQLLQAEAMKYGVEHLRRNRGRCMGALYWQINDIWPVASWASIDYYGRYKALQYYAKRFFSPVLISCEEIGEKDTKPEVNLEPGFIDYETKASLAITNDTLKDVSGKVRWALTRNDGTVLQSDEFDATVKSMSVERFEQMDFNKTDVENNYLSFEFEVDGKVVSDGTVLFTAPKHFEFCNPNLSYMIEGNKITVTADAYAKNVEIYSPDSDFILSDNYFDINKGSKTVEILEGEPKTIILRSVYDIN